MKHWIIKIILLIAVLGMGDILSQKISFDDYLLGYIVGVIALGLLELYDIFTVKSQSDQK